MMLSVSRLGRLPDAARMRDGTATVISRDWGGGGNHRSCSPRHVRMDGGRTMLAGRTEPPPARQQQAKLGSQLLQLLHSGPRLAGAVKLRSTFWRRVAPDGRNHAHVSQAGLSFPQPNPKILTGAGLTLPQIPSNY